MSKTGGGHGRGSVSDKIDFKDIAERALSQSATLLKSWLPKGHKSGFEWKSCNPTRSDNHEGSFSINMTTGAWADFAGGKDDRGGDLISLCAYLFHGGDQLAGVKDVAQQLGLVLPPPMGGRSHDSVPPDAAPPAKPSDPAETTAGTAEAPRRTSDWIPQRAAPADASEAPRAHIKRGLPEKVWHYRDADGATLGYVFRFKTSDGGKEVLPVCWAQHAVTGKQEWRWMHFAEPRALYGLDRLAAKPETTVLVVEGEKCADVAHELFPELAVVTWSGGTNAEHKADWAPIAGRKVIIWPDADAKREKLSKEEKEAGLDPLSKPFLDDIKQAGLKAALKIAERLDGLGCKVWLVNIGRPGDKPDGWDVADMAAAGELTAEAFPGWLRENVSLWSPETISAPSESISTAKEAAAGKREDSWFWRLLRTDKGKIESCVANVFDVLVHEDVWNGVIAFDEHAQRVVKLKPPPYHGCAVGEWDAQDDTQTAMWMTRRMRFAPSSATVLEAVESLAKTNSFHPVRDWLRGLAAWDGTGRLEHWLSDFLGVSASEYTKRVGTWFIMGMIARVMKPGCKFDYCLVLEGPQGKGKSTALNILAGDAWFGDTDLDLQNKDAMIALAGKWLYEISEMGAIARSEEKRQKSFLSRRVDEFRPPYGRRDIKCPRQLVFAGTTNEWEWNKDPTGGRRFWPVSCGELNLEGLKEVREQLFAEALAYFDAGNRYWPTQEEQAKLFDPEQLKREQQESLVDALHDWVFLQYADFSIATAAMEGLKLDASKLTRDLQTRIGTALRKLGCTKVEKRNGMTRFWYKPPARNGAGSMTGASDSQENGGTHAPF